MRITEPTTEFIAALASSLGGTLTPQEDERLPCITFDSPRCQLHIRASWDARPKWRASLCDVAGKHIHQSESANFNHARPLPAIAAELRRRVLEASRPAIIAHYTRQRASEADQAEITRRITCLENAMQTTNQTQHYHNDFIVLPGLRIRSAYDFGGSDYRPDYDASITVHSFDCLLMIARIIAEDHRIHACQKAAESSTTDTP